LRKDGLTPFEVFPQKLSLEDLESAQRIVSFCELPEEYQQKAIVEKWDNIPPISENYEKARYAMLEQLNELLNRV